MKQHYLIAILPPKELSTEIDQIRKECSKRFQVFKALRPPVHITLKFIPNLEDSYEDRLINSLNQARNFKPFIQELRNFSGFENAKAVYVRAVKNKQIDDLYQNIKILTKDYSNDPYPSLNPHLTIAYRDLNESLYLKIMAYYQNKAFKATFEIDHFSLLKHDRIKWNVIKQYYSRPDSEQLEIPL